MANKKNPKAVETTNESGPNSLSNEEKKKIVSPLEAAAEEVNAKVSGKTDEQKAKDAAGKMSPEQVKAALQDIMKESAEETEKLLQTSESDRLDGAKPEASSYDPVMQNQRDFVPGSRRHDLTRVPEFAYDEKSQNVRRVSIPNEYHYVWVHPEKLDAMHSWGYRLVKYDGGNQSGLAQGGLRGTNMFERTIDAHVRNGDTFLMFAPIRLYEAMQQHDREQMEAWEMAAETDHHNLGYRYGVRTFKEEDGQLVYN